MRALVVGANGLVGSRLVAELSRREHRVTALGRGPSRIGAKVPYVSVDLADAAALVKTIEVTKPEVIFNCAAMTDVDGCERAPAEAWAANVEGVATVAKAARAAQAHLVHVSTDYVFDGEAGPYDVDALPNPRGVYALSKHAGEEAVRALCEPNRWTIARTAVVRLASGRPKEFRQLAGGLALEGSAREAVRGSMGVSVAGAQRRRDAGRLGGAGAPGRLAHQRRLGGRPRHLRKAAV
jgi:dTDP-4-dehydrorhamnose reductase